MTDYATRKKCFLCDQASQDRSKEDQIPASPKTLLEGQTLQPRRLIAVIAERELMENATMTTA